MDEIRSRSFYKILESRRKKKISSKDLFYFLRCLSIIVVGYFGKLVYLTFLSQFPGLVFAVSGLLDIAFSIWQLFNQDKVFFKTFHKKKFKNIISLSSLLDISTTPILQNNFIKLNFFIMDKKDSKITTERPETGKAMEIAKNLPIRLPPGRAPDHGQS